MDMSRRRVLIASNRLPVTVTLKEGALKFSKSSGGLVSALSSVLANTAHKWIGWPGAVIPQDSVNEVEKTLLRDYSAVPVFLSEELHVRFVNGFSNSVIWPLLHDKPDRMSSDESFVRAYYEANRHFAETIASHIRDGDLIWIHDFHLMMVPHMLREILGAGSHSHFKIGFFLHTPFPDVDFYNIIPDAKAILSSLLHCDLVGFHIDGYAENFHKACYKLLNAHAESRCVKYHSTNTRIGTFPIGISPSEFHDRLNSSEVKEWAEQLRSHHKDNFVFLGVDRLDYIKGIPQKLHAFDRFLQKNPQSKGRTSLLQVVVPSRGDVDEYHTLRLEIQDLVSEINGKHASTTWVPIMYLHKPVPPAELTALYATAGALVVSSTRDGMNLVCYEYVACQNTMNGVVILSKFAGAAETLPGSILINPWNVEEHADALETAMTMDRNDRANNQRQASDFVHNNTAHMWSRSFLSILDKNSLATNIRQMTAGEQAGKAT